MTRQRAVERSPLVAERVPLIAETMPHIAHPAIRNRGTIGGSLAHADPAAELPAVMLALKATPDRAQRKPGTRAFAADEFFVGLFSTAVEPGELLTEIRIPPRAEAQRLRVPGNLEAARRFRAGRRGCRRAARRDRPLRRARASRCSASATGRCSPNRQRRALTGQLPSAESIRAAADAAATRDIDPLERHPCIGAISTAVGERVDPARARTRL